jgi:hypothetical protein
MRRPPREADVPLFRQGDWKALGARGAKLAGGSLAAYAIGTAMSADRRRASAMAFTSIVVAQLLESKNHRASTRTDNRALDATLFGSLVAQAIALGSAGVRRVLGNPALSAGELVSSLAIGILSTRRAGSAWFPLAPRDEILITKQPATPRLGSLDRA